MALREVKSELEAIYNFYLDIKDNIYLGGPFEYVKNGNYWSLEPTHGNSFAVSSKIMYYLIDSRGKNGFPKVVPNDIYNQIPSSPIYRGEEKIKYAIELIDSPTYHYGDGAYGVGIYTTNSYEDAYHYATFCSTPFKYPLGEACVCEYKCSPNANIASYKAFQYFKRYMYSKLFNDGKELNISQKYLSIKEKIDEFIEFLKSTNDPIFSKEFTRNNLLAAYLGIDALERKASYKSEKTHYIFINRGALCISESEKERVMNLNDEVIQIR